MLAGCPSPSPADPAADPWMADNPTDIADNGTVPSPGIHWISPDVWNRRAEVTTNACVQPPDSYGDLVTTGGIVRDCGTSADHENPITGVTNYLYGTLRNTRPNSPSVAYAEVGVYYGLASSGLTYPTDFTMIPETRQFTTLYRSSPDHDQHRPNSVDSAAAAAGERPLLPLPARSQRPGNSTRRDREHQHRCGEQQQSRLAQY